MSVNTADSVIYDKEAHQEEKRTIFAVHVPEDDGIITTTLQLLFI